MNATEIQELRAKFRGELITPGDAAYDGARQVYNAMIDKRPALIARCADVADVVAGVNFAREKKLLLAVRGGGHNGPGLGVCDGGLVIDLSRLRGSGWTRRTAACASRAGACGATWTTRPTRSASPCRAGSSRRRAWAA